MAKKSKIVREFHLQKKVQKHYALRKELRAIIKNPNISDEEKDKAITKLQKLPRSSNPSRVVRRCALTGRPKGVYRKFGLSRTKLRELAMSGKLPGIKKSSW